MKNIGIIFCLLMSVQLTRAQSMSTVIKTQALEMGKALAAGDAKTFSRYMLPELRDSLNGMGKANITMDSAFAMFKAFGGNVERITYGNPGKIVKFNKELQSTLPQVTSITSPFADIEVSSTLVAISRDEGRNWYFIDTSMSRVEQLKVKFPNISPDLIIPEPVPPKVTMKQQQ